MIMLFHMKLEGKYLYIPFSHTSKSGDILYELQYPSFNGNKSTLLKNYLPNNKKLKGFGTYHRTYLLVEAVS